MKHRRHQARQDKRSRKRFEGKAAPKNKKDRGLENERRFLQALRAKPEENPWWFLRVRESTFEEDSRGIDAIVETADVHSILVQIKSSEMGKKKFLRRQAADPSIHPHIVVVIVRSEESYEEIRANAFRIIGEKRDFFIRTRHP